jgi:hypothetical protein
MYIHAPQDQKIDLVYTYVNTDDPKWVNKISKTLGNYEKSERFNFFGEIYFSLLTVQKFMNWINHIFIVTDEQSFSLDFLDKDFSKKISFIDHKTIIPIEYLPTFNSMVIETYIWKIPNLTDYFIYMNDDFFLGNYMNHSDFFTKNRILKMFVKKIRNKRFNDEKLRKEGYLVGRENAVDLFFSYFKNQKKIYLNLHHVFYTFHKYSCELAYYIFKSYLDKTSTLKIRTYEDPTLPLENKKLFDILILYSLMANTLNVAKYEIFNYAYHTEYINEESYKYIFEKKPIIYCINSLKSSLDLSLWNKLRENYFKQDNFIDNYEVFKNFLKNKIEYIKSKKIKNTKLDSNKKNFMKKMEFSIKKISEKKNTRKINKSIHLMNRIIKKNNYT